MPEASNATKSRLDRFIRDCEQLQQIYAVDPLTYTDIMGEWWQRINDIIYALGLTYSGHPTATGANAATEVNIAWTVPELGKKRSNFFAEPLADFNAEGEANPLASQNSTVAGTGTTLAGTNTRKIKAHKYGLIQSIDKLFQRNVDTWGSLYGYFYNKTHNPDGTLKTGAAIGEPADLSEMIFGQRGLSDADIDSLFGDACRNLTGTDQGLANSLKHFIEDVVGSNLYDFLDPLKQTPEGADEPKGLNELLFGTNAQGKPLSIEELRAKWNQMERGDRQKEGIIGRSNDIVDRIGQDLFDWISSDSTKCMFDYTANGDGPHSLQELFFGKWDINGPTDPETNASTGPSWCEIVSNLRSSGLLTEVYNITNYLGDGYQNYVDLQNKIKEPDNPDIPKVTQENLVKEDPLQTLKNIGVGQVLYGAKDSNHKLNYENDWIFKSANICTSEEEVQNIIEYAADQQKIFDTFKRVSWKSTGDNPLTDGYVYPKITVVDDNTLKVDGLLKAYAAYVKVAVSDEEENVEKVIKVMPLPEVECVQFLGEMPGIDSTGAEKLSPSGACSIGDYWYIVADGKYAGHQCKAGEFLLCIANGNSAQSCWKVVNDSAYRLQAFNSSRTCPPFTRFNKFNQVGYLYTPGTENLEDGQYTEIQTPYEFGDCYKIVTPGKYSGISCNADDIIYCNTSGGESGEVTSSHWTRVQRTYTKFNQDGSIEDWYNWYPTTQTIHRADDADIFDFWKKYNGPYEAFGNNCAFIDYKSFVTTTDLAWDSTAEKNSSRYNPTKSPIHIKGRIGHAGTVTALPANHKIGDAYVVESPGTYAGEKCFLYDTIICTKTGTTAKNSDWTVFHKLIWRNHGWQRMNRIVGQYGIPNVQSDTFQIFKDTCRTEKIKVGDETESYFTASAISTSSDSNWPRIAGRLVGTIINKEEAVHRGVSGNATSGYTINDDGNIYSLLQVEIPYGKYNSGGTASVSRQYWYGYTITWQCPRYKTEQLALTRTKIGIAVAQTNSSGEFILENNKLQLDEENSIIYPTDTVSATKTTITTAAYWLICKGSISGMDISLGDPVSVIVNGACVPCVKQGGVWGIREGGVFYPLTRYEDDHAYSKPVYYVEYSTQDHVSYVGLDSNNNDQFTFNGEATAAKAKSKYNAKQFRRIEKRDMSTSVKRAVKLIGTDSIVETTTTTTGGMTGFKVILDSGASALNPDTFSSWDDPESDNWPFQTKDYEYGYGTGDERWSVVNDSTVETVSEYGGWGATSQYTTVTNNWIKITDTENNTYTWKKTSSTSTTSNNRPLRTFYCWDLAYYMRYQWWNTSDFPDLFNEGEYRFIKYHSYNIPDLTFKTPEYLTSSSKLGLSVNSWSKACPWESRSWKYDTDTNSVKIGVNSVSLLGLISNKKYSEYMFDCVPASHTDDDDNLGIVLAGTNNYQTGMYNALLFVRSHGSCSLQINNNATLWSISNSPVFRVLNGQYCRTTTMYGESVYRPIIALEEEGEASWDNTASNCTGFNRYHLSTFEIGDQKYVNKAVFWMKPTYITEGPSGNGTKDSTMTGRINVYGNEVAGSTEHVKNTVRDLLNRIKPNEDGTLSNLAYKRCWHDPDKRQIREASPCNNVYGMWLAPFHLDAGSNTVSAADYWNLLPADAQKDTLATIKTFVKKVASDGTESDITENEEAFSIFENAIYPKFSLSTYDVENLTLDDIVKLYQNLSAGGTFPIANVSNLNITSIAESRRWVISGYGWLNLFKPIDLNYRVIVQRKYNASTGCYDITLRYKDIFHRLDAAGGKYKKTVGNRVRTITNDKGFTYFNDNQTYKGDIIITVVKNGYDASGNAIIDKAYNITVWQERNAKKTLISYVRLLENSTLVTVKYTLDDFGRNIEASNTDQYEVDAYGRPFTKTDPTTNAITPIKKLLSADPTSSSLAGQDAWKNLDSIMTNIASYGYINSSTPLSEYKNIKFVDLVSGEIYDIENNSIYRIDQATNDYYKDVDTNLSAEQEAMNKFGVGRFLYNDVTNRLFFARGDTDSIQAIT